MKQRRSSCVCVISARWAGSGVGRWLTASLSNQFLNKRIQLVFIFDAHKLVDNITTPHGYDGGYGRHLWHIGIIKPSIL